MLEPQSTLRDAIELTLSSFQADFSVCDGDRLVGLLTYPRLLEALERYSPDAPVSEAILTDITPAAPDEEIISVQQRMAEAKLDALTVVNGDHYLGLITSRDISELYSLVSSQPDIVAATRLAELAIIVFFFSS